MPQVVSCPSAQELQELLLGNLSDAMAEELEEHLLHCPVCVETLRSLPTADTLLSAIRPGEGEPHESESTYVEGLIHRLESIQEPASELTLDAERAQESAKPEALAFLAPPQSADELGRL